IRREALRIDLPAVGVMADPPDRAVNILVDLGNDVARLGSVNDGEHGVAPFQEGQAERGMNRLLRGEEAATDDQDGGGPVLLFRLEDVKGESRAELASVDQVFGAGVWHVLLRAGGPWDQEGGGEESAEESGIHWFSPGVPARGGVPRPCCRSAETAGCSGGPRGRCAGK